MDRRIVWPGQIPLDTDLLETNQFAMIALGYLAQMAIGAATIADGLACAPTSPAGMTVNVGQGSLLALETIEATAYGSLNTDSDPLVKIGINPYGVTNFSCPAPSGAGNSVNYLIEAAFSEADAGSTVLPYYNAGNPAQPYSGPANAGTPNYTVRQQRVTLTLKAGSPATTGTQTTPAVDAGNVGLWVVTVANGQSSITSSSIAQYPGAPFLPNKLPAAAWGSSLWIDTGSANAMAATLNPPPASMAALTGVPLRIKKGASANTGAFTLNVNGLGAASVLLPGGGTPFANVAPANGVLTVVYDGTAFEITGAQPAASSLAHGQCYFSYSTATAVVLKPKNGNNIIINGAQYQIPSAGVSAANTSVYVNGTASQNLSASTAYYVALANIAGTLTLGFFAVASYSHAPDTTAGNAGVEVITSSGTPQSAWTLMGMVYTNGSSQFQTGLNVISWFNRTNLIGAAGVTAVTNASTTGAEFSTQPRVYFCNWTGEIVLAQGIGEASNSIAGDGVGTYIGFNVTTGAPSNSTNIPSIGGAAVPQGALISSSTLPEGVNFATLLGQVSAGTGTFTFTFDVIVRG